MHSIQMFSVLISMTSQTTNFSVFASEWACRFKTTPIRNLLHKTVLSPPLYLRTIPNCLFPCWNGKEGKAFPELTPSSLNHISIQRLTQERTLAHISRQTLMCVDTQECTDLHRTINVHIQTQVEKHRHILLRVQKHVSPQKDAQHEYVQSQWQWQKQSPEVCRTLLIIGGSASLTLFLWPQLNP